MRQRAGRGLIGRIQFAMRNRPVLAVAVTLLSLLVVASAITLTTPLRCGPAKALGLKGIASTCITVGALARRPSPTPNFGKPFFPTPFSGPFPPYNNPYSPPDYNPASGAYPPVGYPASGSYPPFYPPVSPGYYAGPRPTFDCRLPVYAGPPGSGGFIVFPGGSFIADPNSNVTLPAASPSAPPVGGPGPGYGYGYGSLSYDHQFSRWVPVPLNQVSPDGSRYAYATSADGIYVVNVANGTQTEIGAGHSWAIASVQADRVYAGDPNAGGLWVLPFSGTPRQITKTGYWRAATSTAAYGTATSQVPPGATNSIIRLDLNTGATSEWFTRQGAQSGVSGFDSKGNTIISVSYLNGSGQEIWIATGPTAASAIAGFIQQFGPSGGFSSYSAPVADSHGVWFAGNYSNYGQSATGVALYVAGSGFYWMSSIGGQLAGGCY